MFEEDYKLKKILRKELDDCLAKEESFWRHKSREVWLKEGDRNTQFFHNLVKTRKATNNFFEIQNLDGVLIQDSEGINLEAVNFFSQKKQ